MAGSDVSRRYPPWRRVHQYHGHKLRASVDTYSGYLYCMSRGICPLEEDGESCSREILQDASWTDGFIPLYLPHDELQGNISAHTNSLHDGSRGWHGTAL